MEKILIPTWKAVELFCKIEQKLKNLPVDYFNSNANIEKIILNYNPETLEDSGEKIFGFEAKIYPDKQRAARILKKQPIRETVSLRLGAYYYFVKAIRMNEPIVIEKDVLHDYTKFIGEEALIDSYMIEFISFKKQRNQRKFEGTEWWMYRFGEDISGGGIVRGRLKLLPFGNAELKSYYTKSNEIESFQGAFSVNEPNGDFLHLKMKTKDDRKLDLRATIYVGDTMPTVALGQISNFKLVIYSGSIMIELISEENSFLEEKYFFRYSDENFKLFPEHVKSYFSRKENNIILVPVGITNVASFSTWHKSKNPS